MGRNASLSDIEDKIISNVDAHPGVINRKDRIYADALYAIALALLYIGKAIREKSDETERTRYCT